MGLGVGLELGLGLGLGLGFGFGFGSGLGIWIGLELRGRARIAHCRLCLRQSGRGERLERLEGGRGDLGVPHRCRAQHGRER